MGISPSGTVATAKPAHIELARVIDVDISSYTVSVTTNFGRSPYTGVSFATPYQHFSDGEGIYFMPEVGSLCYVCFPSDHNRPFVLAWAAAQDDNGDFRAKKRDLNPGDMFLGTRDNNFLYLRRGGIVQIGGGPLNQRLYMPVNNLIKDLCENYSLQTLGGDLSWSVQRTETTTDGKRPALFSILAREYANDPAPIAELTIGSHGEGEPTILNLLVKDKGQDGAASQVELKLKKDGSVDFMVKKDVTWTIGGKLDLKVTDDATVKVDGKVTVSGQTGMELSSGAGGKISTTQDLDINAPNINMMAKVNVGGGAFPVVLATPDLLLWLVMHSHKVIAPGLNTGPAYFGPPGTPAPGPTLITAVVQAKTLKST
jgi:hypothetical protein